MGTVRNIRSISISFLAIGLIALSGIALTPADNAQASRPCRGRGTTLTASSTVRIFRQTDGSGRVSVCRTASSGRSWSLGPQSIHGYSATMPGPFAISANWAGGFEQRQVGQDTTEFFSSAVNAANGKRRLHCLIGGADRPGQLPQTLRLLITRSGVMAWALKLRSGAAKTIQIGACESGKTQIVAEGSDIVGSSVKLHDFQLSWDDAEGSHSVLLGHK